MALYALIVAAGSGSRMKSDTPKQFLLLQNKPILYYSIKQFLDYHPDLQVVLVTNPTYEKWIQPLMELFSERERIQITDGGATRFDSVKNGLSVIPDEDIVFIHDGVRPFISTELINRCLIATELNGHAIPCIGLKDSIRIISGEQNHMMDRNFLRAIQTPQTFHAHLIKQAFQQDYSPSFTDEASVLESTGIAINLIEGEAYNIKITTPEDLAWATFLQRTNQV